MPSSRRVLKGSQRPLVIPRSAPAHNPATRIELTLKLRPRPKTAGLKKRIEAFFRAAPGRRRYFTPQEHASAFGARLADLAKVEAFARRYRLSVLERSAARRTIRLSGTVTQIQRAFGVRLRSVRVNAARYHAHRESVTLPGTVHGVVRAVFGLDTRPIARSRIADASAAGGISPRAVCQAYNFPANLDGSGQCVAVIELNEQNSLGALGTGYLAADLDQFFSGSGIKTPAFTAVPGANGAGNLPGLNVDADGEAALDLQVAAAAAPGASFAVYFGLNGPDGYYGAMSAAVHDAVRRPRVISTSWGDIEGNYSPQFRAEMEQLFVEAAALGITICASAGDLGSSGMEQGTSDNLPHPDYPASSPCVLACGGTSATFDNGAITAESSWNNGYPGGAGGGGVSELFPLPPWQKACSVPASPGKFAGRGIPDLAAHADPLSGYAIIVHGAPKARGGTSAVAPLIAGLLARINQARAAAGSGPLGFVNPSLYGNPKAFHDIVAGNNDIDGKLGLYSAQSGWDACTGLGSPDGTALLKILS
jgi:kumamolisin